MTKHLIIGALLAAGAATALPAATTVSYTPGASALGAGQTVFQNFDALAPGTSLGTNASVFAASESGIAARPAFNSTGNFAAVLGTPTNGSYTVNFAPTASFSFVIGSVDTYNSLTLLYQGGGSQLYTGGQIINDLFFPSGNQISGETNGRVKYTSSGPKIIGATFGSTANSFEFDNLATGAVPEPAAWAMMLGGFGFAGVAMRRRRSAIRVTYA